MEHFDLSSLLHSAASAVIFGAAFVLISVIVGALWYFVFNAFRFPYVIAFRAKPAALRSAVVKDVSLHIRKIKNTHISDFLFITTYGIGFSLLSYAAHDGGIRLYMAALSVGSSYAFSKLFKITVSRWIFYILDLFLLLFYNLISLLYVCFGKPILAIRKIKCKKLKK